MDKSELENIYKILSSCYDKFSDAQFDYKNGRNAKTRTEAERKMSREISLAKRLILGNEFLYKLASGGDNISDYSRAINLDETFRINYFSGDIQEILSKLKKYINELKD